MINNRHTNFILIIIAVGIWANLMWNVIDTGPANAQAPFTSGVIDVNIVEFGGSSVNSSNPLPVDLQEIDGATPSYASPIPVEIKD